VSREIYYFSGTGNSLVVARDIAARLGGRAISIPSVMDRVTVQVDADVLGIVCPTYYMRMPRIVERFIGKLIGLESSQVFVVATVGGVAGGVLDRFSEAVSGRGGSLGAGFVVRMPANYIHDADALPVFLQKRMFRNWEQRADKLAERVLSGDGGPPEKSNPLMTTLFARSIDRRYLRGELDPAIDANFWADDRCNGCGICVRVCPVGNIGLVDDRPVWRHQCEKCLACLQWCPQEALQFKDVTLRRKRYRHPEVGLSDMLKRSEW
jgi:ferredoxin